MTFAKQETRGRWAPSRGLAAAALAAFACVTIAGCGSGGSKPAATASTTTSNTTAQRTTSTSSSTTQQTTSTSTATAQPEGKGAAPTKVQAVAYAHAVNLHAGDVPGFTQKGSEHAAEKTDKETEESFDRCSDLPPEDAIAEESSPEFERKSGQSQSDSVKSEVTVVPNATIAAEALAGLKRERAGTCLSSYLSAALSKEPPGGATVGQITATKIAAPANSFGWRLSVPLTVHEVSLSLHVDLLGFVDGRAEVSLFVSALPELFPPATERHLVSLLMERAKSHEL